MIKIKTTLLFLSIMMISCEHKKPEPDPTPKPDPRISIDTLKRRQEHLARTLPSPDRFLKGHWRVAKEIALGQKPSTSDLAYQDFTWSIPWYLHHHGLADMKAWFRRWRENLNGVDRLNSSWNSFNHQIRRQGGLYACALIGACPDLDKYRTNLLHVMNGTSWIYRGGPDEKTHWRGEEHPEPTRSRYYAGRNWDLMLALVDMGGQGVSKRATEILDSWVEKLRGDYINANGLWKERDMSRPKSDSCIDMTCNRSRILNDTEMIKTVRDFGLTRHPHQTNTISYLIMGKPFRPEFTTGRHIPTQYFRYYLISDWKWRPLK